MTPTKEQITKLPKWAQDHILYLEGRRQEAERALRNAIDSQVPSPFFTEDAVNTGNGNEVIRTYFNAAGRHMTVEHDKIRLEIRLPMGVQGREGIELQWSDMRRHLGDVALVPQSYQRVALLSKEKLRT